MYTIRELHDARIAKYGSSFDESKIKRDGDGRFADKAEESESRKNPNPPENKGTPRQIAAQCLDRMSKAEISKCQNMPAAIATVEFFASHDQLKLSDSQIESIALRLVDLCRS